MNVLEVLTEERVDRAHVERRVEDWKHRIAALYGDVSAWLPAGWRAEAGGSLAMREELMRRFGVPEQQLPVLVLVRDGQMRGKLEPRGLWIIGANGRVDLTLPDRHFLFVDRAESFDPPDWQVASILARREQKPFNRETLVDVLA